MERRPSDAATAVEPLLRVRQTREFSDEPVDPAELAAIADVARWTGSAGNRQPWRFITIRSVETLRKIGAAGMPSTASLRSATAAIAIVMPDEPGRGISTSFDEGRAAERILIAAAFCGLGAGIAWVPAEARATVAELLGVPADRFVRTVVAVGHPTPRARLPKAAPGEARLPREETVLSERWPA